MPVVPESNGPQVRPTGPSVRGFNSPLSPDAAALPGRQLQQAGSAMQQAGGQAAQLFNAAQEEANILRVTDALNKTKERALSLTYDKNNGFTSQKGIAALERPNGKALADEYGELLSTDVSSISQTLGNDAQRRMYQQQADGLVSSFKQQATVHEANEFRTYTASVYEGTITTAANTIGLQYNDPDAVDGAVARIKASVAALGRMNGKSATWIEAQQRNVTSSAHSSALMAALEAGNVEYADGYMKKYKDQLEPNDLLRVQGVITKEMDTRAALDAVKSVSAVALPTMMPGDADRAFNLLIGTESSGRQFGADGKPLTSSAGAVGIAQVMPKTAPEAARMAGLPWDENRYKNDPDYNKALGKAYFGAQLRAFDGDVQKAWAAYNAGAGRVQAAVDKGGADWLSHMPDETKAYVAKNSAEFAVGGGRPALMTEADFVEAAVAKLGPNPPASREMAARTAASQRYSQLSRAVKDKEEAVLADTLRTLTANGGDLNAVPVSLKANLNPSQIDTAMNFADKLSKGTEVRTNMALYQKLATDDNYLKGLSDNAFFALRPQLSDSDFKHFVEARSNLLNPASDAKNPKNLNSGALNTALNDRLVTIDIDPTPAAKDKAGAARVGVIRKFVRDSVLVAQQQAGHVFTPAELEVHIDGLFNRSVEFQNSLFGLKTGTRSERLLATEVDDISGEDRQKITAALKARGIGKPSEADILGVWFREKARS